MSTISPMIITRDLEPLVRFYTELFGAEEAERLPAEGPAFFLGLRIGDSHLGFVANAEIDTSAPQRLLLSIDVENVDKLLERVEALGGTVLGPPKRHVVGATGGARTGPGRQPRQPRAVHLIAPGWSTCTGSSPMMNQCTFGGLVAPSRRILRRSGASRGMMRREHFDATTRSGLDLRWVDPAVRPQDDLFGHVNGQWLRTHEIPDDRAQDGAFRALRDRAEEDVHAIVEGAAGEPGTDARKIADLYRSFMDVDAIEAAGVEPLRPLLDEVFAATDKAELAAVLGRRQREGQVALFGAYVSTDAKDSTRYIVHLSQSGLGLPDESYYREDAYAEIRTAYVAPPDPARRAGRAGRARAGRRDGDGPGDGARRGLVGPRDQPRRPQDLHADDAPGAAGQRARVRLGAVARGHRRAVGRVRRRGRAAAVLRAPRPRSCGRSARSSSGRPGSRSARRRRPPTT